MTVNLTLGEYGLITDDSNGKKLKIRHSPTGVEQVIDQESFQTPNAAFASKPWVDVTHPDFGAKGDGSTDDTAAIQSAIDSSSAGDMVFFPPGDYYITSKLELDGNRKYSGVNSFLGTRSRIFTDQAINMLESRNHSSERQDSIQIQGLAVDGQGAATRGMYLEISFSTIQFNRVYNIPSGGDGIHITSDVSGISLNNRYRYNSVLGNSPTDKPDTGIFEDYGTADSEIIGNYIDNIAKYGIFARGHNTNIESNHVFVNEGYRCIRSDGAERQRIVNNHCAMPAGPAIEFTNGSYDGRLESVVIGNTIRGANQAGNDDGVVEAAGDNLDHLVVMGNTATRDPGATTTVPYFFWTDATSINGLYVSANAVDTTNYITTGRTNIDTDAEANTFNGSMQLPNGNRVENSSTTANSREMITHDSVGDTNSVQLLSVATDTGKVLVVDRSNGSSAEFTLDAVNNTVTKVTDPDTAFSTTSGNSGTTNVYYNSTNSQFELENQTGGTASYSVHLLA